MAIRMRKRTLIVALVVVAMATISVLGLSGGDDDPRAARPSPSTTAAPTWPAYLFVTDERRPRLYDLCEKDDAQFYMETDAERRNFGIDCGNPAAIRYVGSSAGYEPLFTPRQLEKGKAWFASENRRYDKSFFEPDEGDFFGSTPRDVNGCRSTGLKKPPRAAYGVVKTKADIDGDGKLDRVTSYRFGDPAYGSNRYHLRTELGTGTVLDIEDPHYSLVIDSFYGSSDLDHNGRAELWIEPNTNKPGAVAMLVFYSCELKLVQEGDEDFWIHTYGRPDETTDVGCQDDRIVWTFTSEPVKDPYSESTRKQEESWFFYEYRLLGASLVTTDSGRGDELDDRPDRIKRRQEFECFTTS
jgi:hypothetical protein